MQRDLMWTFTDERKQYDHELSLNRPAAAFANESSNSKKSILLLFSSFVYANKIKVNKSWHRRWVLLNKLFIHLVAAFSFDLTQGTQCAVCEP